VEGNFTMVATSLDFDTHKGKHVIGRISAGQARVNMPLVIIKHDGSRVNAKIDTLFTTNGLKKIQVEQAIAGDLVDITGAGEAEIADTIADPSVTEALPRIKVEEPTIKIALGANTSPFAGREGKFSNSRQLLERLEKELEDRIARLAAAKGSNKSTIVREAVIRYLEDQEDTVLAQRARKTRGKVRTIAEVRKALGLDG